VTHRPFGCEGLAISTVASPGAAPAGYGPRMAEPEALTPTPRDLSSAERLELVRVLLETGWRTTEDEFLHVPGHPG